LNERTREKETQERGNRFVVAIAHRWLFEDLSPRKCSRDRKLISRLARSDRARDLTHAWSPPIAVLSVQESVSGASCTSSGGSFFGEQRERVGTTRASVNHIAARSTRRLATALRVGVRSSPTAVREDAQQDARRRWSATAKDHLSTAVG